MLQEQIPDQTSQQVVAELKKKLIENTPMQNYHMLCQLCEKNQSYLIADIVYSYDDRGIDKNGEIYKQAILAVLEEISKNIQGFNNMKNLNLFLKCCKHTSLQVKKPEKLRIYQILSLILSTTKQSQVFTETIQVMYSFLEKQDMKKLMEILHHFRYGENVENSQISFKNVYMSLSEQQQLIISLEIQSIFWKLEKESITSASLTKREKIIDLLQKHPYEKLYLTAMRFTLKQQIVDRFKKDFYTYQVRINNKDQAQYFFDSHYLHPNIMTPKNLYELLKRQSLIYSYLPQQLGKITKKGLLCHLNTNILQQLIKSFKMTIMEEQINHQTVGLKFSRLLSLMINNKSMKLLMVGNCFNKQFQRFEYLCYLSTLTVKHILSEGIKQAQQMRQFLPQEIYLGVLTEIQEGLCQQKFESNAFYNYMLPSFVRFQAFLTQQRGNLETYNMFNNAICQKLSLIIKNCNSECWKKQTWKQIFQLLNYWATLIQRSEEPKCQIFTSLIEQFLQNYVKTNKFQIQILNYPLCKVKCTKALFQKITLLQLKKIEQNYEMNSQKYIKQLSRTLPLINLRDAQNLEHNREVANILLKFYTLSFNTLHQTKLSKYRTWILEYSSQPQLSQNIQNIYPKIIQLFQKLLPQISKWDFDILYFQKQFLPQKQLKQLLQQLLKSCFHLINVMHFKKKQHEYSEKFLGFIFNFLFELASLLHRSQHKIFDFIRNKTMDEMNVILKNKIKMGIKSGNKVSIYGQLESISRYLESTLSYFIVNSTRIFNKIEQDYIVRSISRLLCRIGQQKASQMSSQNYYEANVVTIHQGLCLELIDGMWKGGYKSNQNSFPIQQEFQLPRNDDDEEQSRFQRADSKIKIGTFSIIYEQVSQKIIPVIKNYYEGYLKFKQIKVQELQKIINDSTKEPQRVYLRVVQEKQLMQTILVQEKNQNQGWRNKSESTRKSIIQRYTTKYGHHFYGVINIFILPKLKVAGGCRINGQQYDKATPEMGYGLILHQFKSILKTVDIPFFNGIRLHKFLSEYQSRVYNVGSGNTTANRTDYLRRQLINYSMPLQEIQITIQLSQKNTADQIISWACENRDLILKTLKQKQAVSSSKTLCMMQHQHSHSILPLSRQQYYKKIKEEVKKFIQNLIENYLPTSNQAGIFQMAVDTMLCIEDKQVITGQHFFKAAKSIFTKFEQMIKNNVIQSEKTLKAMAIFLKKIHEKEPSIHQEFFRLGIGSIIMKIILKILPSSQAQTINYLVVCLILFNPSFDYSKDQEYKSSLQKYFFNACQFLEKFTVQNNTVSLYLAKIAQSENIAVQQRAKKTYMNFLKHNKLKSHALSIYQFYNKKEIDYIKANIEHAIKTFIINNCQTSTNGIYKLQIKQLSPFLEKYNSYSELENTCLAFLTKINNETMTYNSNDHDLYFCQTLGIRFYQYQPSSLQKTLIKSLVSKLKQQIQNVDQVNYSTVSTILCLLQSQKLLIPYTISMQLQINYVKGDNFQKQQKISINLLSWLIQSSCIHKKLGSMKLIQFLFLNNGLYVKKGITFSNYYQSLLILSLPSNREQAAFYSPAFKELAQKWTLFIIYSLLKIKDFVSLLQAPYLKGSRSNLLNFIQKQLTYKNPNNTPKQQLQNPINFLIASEIFYIFNEQKILKNIVSKGLYKINRKQNQIDVQFTDLDIILNKKNDQNKTRPRSFLRSISSQLSSDQDQVTGLGANRQADRIRARGQLERLEGRTRMLQLADNQEQQQHEHGLSMFSNPFDRLHNENKQKKEQQVLIPLQASMQIEEPNCELVSLQEVVDLFQKLQKKYKEQIEIQEEDKSVQLQIIRINLSKQFITISKKRPLQKFEKDFRHKYISPKIANFIQRTQQISKIAIPDQKQSKDHDYESIAEVGIENQLEDIIEPTENRLAMMRMPRRRIEIQRRSNPTNNNAAFQRLQNIDIIDNPQIAQVTEVQLELKRDKSSKNNYRQILYLLGLPQSYLKDNSINEGNFDTLNPDAQMQILQKTIQKKKKNSEGTDKINQQNLFEDQSEQQPIPISLTVFPTDIRPNNHLKPYEKKILVKEQKAKIVHPNIPDSYFFEINSSLISDFLNCFYIDMKNIKFRCFETLIRNKNIQKKATLILISEIRKIIKEEKQIIVAKYTNKIEFEKDDEDIFSKKQSKRVWKLEENKITKKQLIKKMLGIFIKAKNQNSLKLFDYLRQEVNTEGLDIPQSKEIKTTNISCIPLFELIDLGFNYAPDVALKLIQQAKDLPISLKRKIVKQIRESRLPDTYYACLENLSEDKEMKQIFLEQFPQSSPPNIKILGKLMNFEFAKLPYIKSLHEKALKNYKSLYNDFLNYVFTYYTKQQLEQLEKLFRKYAKVHFQVLMDLQKKGRQIQSEPIKVILNFPGFLSFKDKVSLFRNHPQLNRAGSPSVRLVVNRNDVFQESFHQIMSMTPEELKGRLSVNFIMENGIDAGGLSRQWFEIISREIIDPKYKLFKKSYCQYAYILDPLSYVNNSHLQYYQFIGRIIGLALRNHSTMNVYFTKAIYKTILGRNLQFQDLQQQDIQLAKFLKQILNPDYDVSGQEFTFCYTHDNFGKKIQRQIIPGGSKIKVTQENKKEYVQKYAIMKMKGDFYLQLKQLIKGISEVIPLSLLNSFDQKELQLLFSGVPIVKVSELKANVDYVGYSESDQIINWFWQILNSCTQVQLAKFLQFVTGISRVPAEGLSALGQKITIYRVGNSEMLPQGHTCSKQLDLPHYKSKEKLENKLLYAIEEGNQGFGFA